MNLDLYEQGVRETNHIVLTKLESGKYARMKKVFASKEAIEKGQPAWLLQRM